MKTLFKKGDLITFYGTMYIFSRYKNKRTFVTESIYGKVRYPEEWNWDKFGHGGFELLTSAFRDCF